MATALEYVDWPQGGGEDDVDGICSAEDYDAAASGRRVSVETERRVRTAEAFLRCCACGLAAAAAAVLGVDRESHDFFGVFVKVARYTDSPTLVFLVIANGVAACYYFVQGLRCLVSIVRGRALVSRPLAWAIFFCDQAMAYVAIYAVATALLTAAISKHGQPQFGWMKTAEFFPRFSALAAGAIVFAVLASGVMAAVSAMSAFNLFRLYGRRHA